MNRIEFIGSPGVGKTTLANRVKEELNSGKIKAIKQDEIPYFLNPVSKVPLLNKLLSKNILLLREAYNILNKVYKVPLINNELRKISKEDKWPDFIEVFYKDLNYHSINIKRINLFNESLALTSFTDRMSYSGIILYDEGLLQRAVSLAFINNDQELIRKYLMNLPKPSAVIIVESKKEIIKARLTKRDGVNSEYLGLLDIALEVVDICKVVMEERGVEIIKVNSENLTNKRLLEITQELQSIVLEK